MTNVSNPKLWKKIVDKVKKGDKYGKSNSWNARKAQYAVKLYKESGGKYKNSIRPPNSLKKWTDEDWGYVMGDKSGRYLPKKVRDKMTIKEKQLENRLKQEGTNTGKKKVPYSDSVLKKFNKTTKPVKKNGKWIFPNADPRFRPTHSPKEMFKAGVFGGTYWRPIKSSITKKSYKNQHKEFPKSWWKGIAEEQLTSSICNKSINKYKKTSGSSLEYWESKKWINPQDPYGWGQWYCRFFMGRRSLDDARQIQRWLNFAGPKDRFRRRLINMINKKRTTYNDLSISPTIRQGLLQWAYELNSNDFKKLNK